ncbi:MAG TPA: hypothetical protein VFR86_17795 [Burkholderiaceae bacterium]|nr:hypothetical protein [Burkholderiaceae bacterium]
MRAIAATPAYAAGDIATEAEYYRGRFSTALRRPEDVESIVRRLRIDFTPAGIAKARAIEARLYAQTWQAPGYDLLPKLRHCNVPAVIIHGEHDFIPRSAPGMPRPRCPPRGSSCCAAAVTLRISNGRRKCVTPSSLPPRASESLRKDCAAASNDAFSTAETPRARRRPLKLKEEVLCVLGVFAVKSNLQ